jgi:hypothetical protein
MKVTLKDGAPRHVGTVEINVSKAGNTVEIGATGVEPAPIVLEYYHGKLTVRLFGEDGLPTMSQEVSTTPTAKSEEALAAFKDAVITDAVIKGVLVAAPVVAGVVAPAVDFDEAAFDAA